MARLLPRARGLDAAHREIGRRVFESTYAMHQFRCASRAPTAIIRHAREGEAPCLRLPHMPQFVMIIESERS